MNTEVEMKNHIIDIEKYLAFLGIGNLTFLICEKLANEKRVVNNTRTILNMNI